jgi:hypothetical protein
VQIRCGRCAVLLATIAAGLPANAQPSPAAAAKPDYPFAVALRSSGDALGARFKHLGSGWMSAPPNPPATVPVGEQARDAYAAAVQRMFQAGAPEAAELEISSVQADMDWDADGWHASVEHALVLRAASGEELGRWNPKGRELIVGLGEGAIPLAFARAAEKAALRFQLSFEEPSGVARWLQDRGVERRSFVSASSFIDRPALIPKPPRGKYVAYLDVGVGFVPYLASNNHLQAVAGSPTPDFTSSSSKNSEAAVAARAGFSGPWVFGQIAVARWNSGMENDSTHVTATSLGLDAGPLLRIGDFEILAGPGAQWITAETTASPASASRVVPSAFGALRWVTGIAAGGARLRVGVEARKLFGATLRFITGETPTTTDWRELELASSFGVFLGFEIPVVRR